MKQSIFIGIALTFCIQNTSAKPSLEGGSVSVEPIWQEIKKSAHGTKLFGEEWILVGNITFKKKTKEWINLSRIHMRWHGDPIDQLLGSLYRKSPDKDFLPLQENLVCDGLWNKKEQLLVLNFDKKESLGALNVFSLVLTVPEELKEVIRAGHFTIETCSLPDQFKDYLHERILSLAPKDINIDHHIAATDRR